MKNFLLNLFKKKYKFLIIGAGSLGLTLNALLKLSNQDTTVIARNYALEYFNKKNEYNYTSEIIGNDKTFSIKIDVKDTNHKKIYDYIFICTKANEIDSIVSIINNCSNKDTIIVPFVTGYGYTDFLKTKIQNQNVLFGYADGPFCKDENFGIKQIGSWGGAYIGYYKDSIKNSKKLNNLESAFSNLQLNTKIYTDAEIKYQIYKKNTYNGLIALVGYHTNMNIGQIFENEQSFKIFKDLLEELSILAEKLGIKEKNEFYNEIFEEMKNFPPELSSPIQNELNDNRKPEIYFYLFNIVELAKQNGLKLENYEKLAQKYENLRDNSF